MHPFRHTIAWLEIVVGGAAVGALFATAGAFLWNVRSSGHAAVYVAIGAAMLLPAAAGALWAGLWLKLRPNENLLLTQSPLIAGISFILYLILLDPPTR